MTDKQLVLAWWKIHQRARNWYEEGEVMNLSLVQRPKRVSASSETLYIYAPSVLMEDHKLKPKTIIKVLEVHEGPTPEETMLKVMENDVWTYHYRNHYGREEGECKLWQQRHTGRYDTATTERPKCVCEGAIEDMPEAMKNATHFVLLSDIGK
jgi:hypothetical protein